MKEIVLLESGAQELQHYKNIIWIGAISFEDRCMGSLEALKVAGVRINKGILVEYPTTAKPLNSDLKKRRSHRKMIKTYLQAFGSKSIPHSVHPYRFGSFNRLLSKFNRDVCLIADISCLTKAHTIALALCIVRKLKLNRDLGTFIISYTRPKEYGDEYGNPGTYKMKHGRWPDVACSPCGFESQLTSEEVNGIILLGHEGPRIALSLNELPPKDALVILAHSPGKEHLQLVTRTVNAQLLEDAKRRGWQILEITYFDLVAIQKAVRQFAVISVEQKRRVALYPFGPKSLIFAAAFEALGHCGSKVWYSYPIPESYDIDYSHGIGETRWFQIH